MTPRATPLLGWCALAISCRSGGPAPPADLEQALERAVPCKAHVVSPASYAGRKGGPGVSGATEFDLDTSWEEYRQWIKGHLGSDWHPGDSGADRFFLTKSTAGDAYVLSLERLSATPAVRVRATATGMPD